MRKTTLLLLLLTALTSTGQTFSEIIKAVAVDRENSDRFGYAVDISGNYAVVGAYSDDFGATNPNMGSAYIFEKAGAVDWTFVQKINNSDQDDYDRFGWSVAIDGDYIIVGAYGEDHNEVDAENLSKAGSAYIFERNDAGVWNEVDKLVASDRSENDEFGWSVAISGTTAIVGAHFESHNTAGTSYIHHSGSVYIFDRLGDGTWNQTQKIVASDRSPDITYPAGDVEDLSDKFGHSLAIHNNYLIVGAYHNDYNADGTIPLSEAGAAYIFERSGGTWTEATKLISLDRETTDEFGYSVAIHGNFATVSAPREDDNLDAGSVINAGAIYTFERESGVWNQTQKITASDRHPGDRLGWSIDIDANKIVAGAPEANTDEEDAFTLSNAGALFTFELIGATWNEINKVDASDRREEDMLGTSVRISNNVIIAGAFQQDYNTVDEIEVSNAGAIYFYGQLDCSPTASSQTLTRCAGDDVIVGTNTYTESGTYTDILTGASGCDSTVTTNLTVTPAPTSAQEIDLCFGYSYTIGTSNYTTSGTYIDTLATAIGCDSIVTTSLTVSAENAVTHDITLCWGESYTIGASTYDTPGTYTDIITSWSLCDCTITSIITQQLPVDNSISQSLNTLDANSEDAEYQWIKCSPFETIPGANDKTYIAPAIGQYAVIVTEGTCSDTSSCVYVSLLGTETNELGALQIYPNPSNGYLTLTNPYSDILTATLYNSIGNEIKTFYPNSQSYIIDIHNLPKGIYVLQLEANEHLRTFRLVLE